MLNSENAILERKNYRNLCSNTVRLSSLLKNQFHLQFLELYETVFVCPNKHRLI